MMEIALNPPRERPILCPEQTSIIPIETDDELVRKFQSGEVTVFNQLDQRYRFRLTRFLQRRGFNAELAEEMTQQTLTNAFEHLPSLRNHNRFSVWIYRIATRLALDEFRRTSPIHFSELEKEVEKKESLSWTTHRERSDSEVFDPSEIAARQEEKENIWAVAERFLAPDEFELLWLYYVDGMSDKEIGHYLNKPPGTIRVVLHRIRKKMFSALEKPESNSEEQES